MSAPTRGAAHPHTTVSLVHTKRGDDLIRFLNEALAHAKVDGPAIVHAPVTPREVRKKANLTQAQMAPLMRMSLSGYRKWEQGTRRVRHRRGRLQETGHATAEALRHALADRRS